MTQSLIDLRSDTVTLPSPAMREAIYNAPLGDDVYGDDPTVNALEKMAAAKVGKEAALLVTSGTQGNFCGVLSHCQRGDEVIVGDKCHIYNYEAGGVSVLGGVAMAFGLSLRRIMADCLFGKHARWHRWQSRAPRIYGTGQIMGARQRFGRTSRRRPRL